MLLTNPQVYPLFQYAARDSFLVEKRHGTQEETICKGSWPTGHNCSFEKAGAKEELMETPGMKRS